MRFNTWSCTCCAVAPGQSTSTVIDGTENFGILELAEPGETQRSGDGDGEDEEDNDGAVPERPLGQVEGFHRAACFCSFACTASSGSATRSPGAIFWTPAVTTRSPAGRPEISTASLR